MWCGTGRGEASLVVDPQPSRPQRLIDKIPSVCIRVEYCRHPGVEGSPSEGCLTGLGSGGEDLTH